MAMLAIFAAGCAIPVPGISQSALAQVFEGNASGLFDLFDIFTGGAFKNFTLFALGVTPYITASIILQLLTVAIPRLEELSNEGATGRKKIIQITRYFTVVLSVMQAAGVTVGLFSSAIIEKSALTVAMIIAILTAGVTFLMWIGEQINEYGIGNGMSLLIFAGIVMRLPGGIRSMFLQVKTGTISYFTATLVIIASVAVIAGVVLIQQGERRIPVQYANKQGRRAYRGAGSIIPIKVNASGVIPIIFALALVQAPITVSYFIPRSKFAMFIGKWLSPNGDPGAWIYMALNVVLIIAFTYFYQNIVFKPHEVAKNIRNGGGVIAGIRPGKPTEDYLSAVSMRLCFIGAVFLAAVSALPIIVSAATPLNLAFGGTSLLIAVGVSMDLVQKVKARMVMKKSYKLLKD